MRRIPPGINPEISKAIAFDLAITIQRVMQVVDDLHNGRIAPFVLIEQTPRNKIRWTPQFSVRPQPSDPQTRPYTAKHIADVLGLTETVGKKTSAARIVRVVFALLELSEQNKLTEQFADAVEDHIKTGGTEIRVSTLYKKLVQKKTTQ
jgi:hypothetical protein